MIKDENGLNVCCKKYLKRLEKKYKNINYFICYECNKPNYVNKGKITK